MSSEQKKKKKINFFAEDTELDMPMSQMIDCVFLLLIFFDFLARFSPFL